MLLRSFSIFFIILLAKSASMDSAEEEGKFAPKSDGNAASIDELGADAQSKIVPKAKDGGSNDWAASSSTADEETNKLKEKVAQLKMEMDQLKQTMATMEEWFKENVQYVDCTTDVLKRTVWSKKTTVAQQKNTEIYFYDIGFYAKILRLNRHGGVLNVSRGDADGEKGKWLSVLANTLVPFPIRAKQQQPGIIFYFEAKLLNEAKGGAMIGFSNITVEKSPHFGDEPTLIGMNTKAGIFIAGTLQKFDGFPAGTDDNFNTGDVIGIGLLRFHSPPATAVFGTLNGKMLGQIKLPGKFKSSDLVPAISLRFPGDSASANFGLKEWAFDAGQLYQ